MKENEGSAPIKSAEFLQGERLQWFCFAEMFNLVVTMVTLQP